MKTKTMSFLSLRLFAVVATVFLTATDLRAEDPAKDPEAAPEVPKKKVKKDAEYMLWDKVVAASEACEQPILAFVELKGDKVSSKIRMMTVANPVFKEFVKDNCLYYHIGVPQEQVRQGRGQPRQKNVEPKPDFSAVKTSEAAAVNKICGSSKTLPVIAVLSPGGGRVIGSVFMSSDEASFVKFIEELKRLFEQAKCEFVINKKVQKVLDDETKKKAALEKRMKKPAK